MFQFKKIICLPILAISFANLTNAQTQKQKMQELNTVQQIGIIKTKPGTWDQYLAVMRPNVDSSRKENGNIAFDLFQPQNGEQTAIWLERWKDQAALEKHFEYTYLKDVRKTVPLVKDGDVKVYFLSQVANLPVELKKHNDLKSAYTIISNYEVLPEKRDIFLNAIEDIAHDNRNAAGNVEFNIYEDKNQTNHFLIIERWMDAKAYSKNKQQAYYKKSLERTAGTYKTDATNTIWELNDIAL